MNKTITLPDLPESMEWVVTAEADRFTVNLAYKMPPPTTPQEAVDQRDGKVSHGYVKSHTHRHDVVIDREQWESEVVNAARHLWTHYTEANQHAVWADELMRRNR